MDSDRKELENPVQGDRIVFRKTADETNGELLEVDMYVEPSASGPPQHIHPEVEEHFRIITGELQAQLGDKEYHFKKGEDFTIPPDTPHTWWNDGEEQARVRVEMRPGTRMQEFFETWYGLAEDGKMSENGLPNIWQLALTTREYSDAVYLASPPLIIQKIIFGALTPIARLLGYKANY